MNNLRIQSDLYRNMKSGKEDKKRGGHRWKKPLRWSANMQLLKKSFHFNWLRHQVVTWFERVRWEEDKVKYSVGS